MQPVTCYTLSLLLLLALLGSASGQVTAAVDGIYGGSALFGLSAAFPSLYSLGWYYSETLVVTQTSGGPIIIIDQYRGRCELYSNGSLRLDNLTYADQGQYKAVLTNLNTGGPSNYPYTLSVYSLITVAPVLSINSSTPDGLVGGTYLSLHCASVAENVTIYTFYRNGKTICGEPHVTCSGEFLHFQPITGGNTGAYTCTIENPFSKNTSNTLQLTVVEPVSGVTLTTNTSGLIWPGLDSVSLRCSANGTNVSYSWSLQGAQLPADPRYHLSQNNSVLTISLVSAKDNGTFTCTAQNSISNGTSNGVKLTLASPVSAVTLANVTSELLWVGQDKVTLHCFAQGSVVHFSWRLNGQPLPSDNRYVVTSGDSPPNSSLTINPVSKADVGPFTCLASNRLNNETSRSVTLSLAWPPENEMLCTAEKRNQDVHLGCSWPGGRPGANVTLNFQNTTGNGTSGVTNLVPSDKVTVGTRLSCHGNQLGRTSNCTMLFALPQFPGHNNDKVTEVAEDTDVDLVVSLETSGPPAQFFWYRYNPNRTPVAGTRSITVQFTNFTSTLRISKATEKDNGKYECEARNLIGSENFFFHLNVTKAAAPPPSGGLNGGEIAGIVIGVLAGITLIGVLVFFLVKKKNQKKASKGMNEPEVQLGTPVYAEVKKSHNKQNGGAAETPMTNKPQEDNDEIKYAAIIFTNNPTSKAPNTTSEETEYSQVKLSTKR